VAEERGGGRGRERCGRWCVAAQGDGLVATVVAKGRVRAAAVWGDSLSITVEEVGRVQR
jgi:hypothetical protein